MSVHFQKILRADRIIRGETYENCPQDCGKPVLRITLLVILVLALLGGGIYFIRKYYVNLYEKQQIKKLFANEKDFYVVTFFIANQSNKGKQEKEIRAELVKAGWNGEQISFGLQKVSEQTKKMQKDSLLNFVLTQLGKGKKS